MRSLQRFFPVGALALAVLGLSVLGSRSAAAQKITVVDMIPNSMSDDQNEQSEPNLAVDPATPSKMAASAFIINPKKPNKGSIFLSNNGGVSWSLQPILPGSTSFCTTSFCDITLRFGGTSGKLYVSALTAKPDNSTNPPGDLMAYQINRFDDVFGNPVPILLEQRTGVIPDCPDQPYVQATTTLGGEGADLDRVFVGVNDARVTRAPQTATVDVNPNAGAASPAMNLEQEIEASMPPNPPGRDGSAVRTAFHASGVVYAAFYSPTSNSKANIVVVRDDNWGTSAPPFSDLVGGSGVSVVAGTAYSGGGTTLAKQRVGRSQISIAVDPNDVNSVWLVWGDASVAPITLRLRHSKDGGKTWDDKDLWTLSFATNPALAVNSLGQVGLLYQAVDQLGLWETRVEISGDGFATPPVPLVLSIADSSSIAFGAKNFIGDYDHMMAIGKDFFGVFSAINNPSPMGFPDVDDLIFQREHDAQKLYKTAAHDFSIPFSIDPFFFHVEMVKPENDFFARDWTEAGSHDPGLEPSSHSVFYKTSDVWNRDVNVSGSPATTAAPSHINPQPGQNFAFVRVGRKAPAMAAAPNVDVTPHFYYADFGAGLAYKDAGGAAPMPITFAPNQKELTLPDGQGYEWTLPDVHSTHVCMGVELDSTDDHFAQPSLLNHVPGWPTLDTAVLYDNNKAQRNIIYPEMKMMSKAHYYALVRNAASVTRNVCLRLDSPVSILSSYTSIQIDACGIATTSYRPGSTVCLPGMTASEVRALKVTVDMPQSAQGADLALAFTEVTQPGPAGKPRDGFAISPVGTTVDAAALANLKFQAAVFGRLAALYNDPAAQFWTTKTRDLVASGFTLSQYVAFLQQVRPYLNRLTGLVPRSTSTCAPSPYGDLDRLLGAIQGADPQLIVPSHNDYLQTLDIAITLSQIAVNGPGA
ncbi:MAG: hypothetical protein ABJC13_16185 [Acidobacteriota bacterium]